MLAIIISVSLVVAFIAFLLYATVRLSKGGGYCDEPDEAWSPTVLLDTSVEDAIAEDDTNDFSPANPGHDWLGGSSDANNNYSEESTVEDNILMIPTETSPEPASSYEPTSMYESSPEAESSQSDDSPSSSDNPSYDASSSQDSSYSDTGSSSDSSSNYDSSSSYDSGSSCDSCSSCGGD